jgi:photosystem II stability/assembly factor-like uncharacterized protein
MSTVRILIGTTKGVFFLRSSAARKAWQLEGPYLPGRAIYSLAHDGRGERPRVWAGAASMHWGAVMVSSDDWGQSWDEPQEANLKFPAESGLELKQIWQIAPGRDDEPGTLYCGVEPAALFRSTDGGKSWDVVRGLLDHPHRERWQPGGGGLCLHTIVRDPANADRMWIAISSGGVYRTEDGGRSWAARNKGIRAEFMPDKYPEFGQCVHKMAQHPSRPGRLFAQNHWGLYRSDDAGDSWKDIAHGVPSDFGFAMTAHPHDADTVYIIPIESDTVRMAPERKLRVYRTRNAGRSWEPLTRGLPQRNVYDIVLRDGLATDSLDPAGVYFGTRNGKVYASNDSGRSWRLAIDGLPSITCVRAAVVADRPAARAVTPRRPARRAKAPRPKPRQAARR